MSSIFWPMCIPHLDGSSQGDQCSPRMGMLNNSGAPLPLLAHDKRARLAVLQHHHSQPLLIRFSASDIRRPLHRPSQVGLRAHVLVDAVEKTSTQISNLVYGKHAQVGDIRKSKTAGDETCKSVLHADGVIVRKFVKAKTERVVNEL